MVRCLQPSGEAGSGLVARDFPPDPRTLAAVTLAAAILAAFETIARQRMHPASYDYLAGGARDEVSPDDNEAAWRRCRLRLRVLVDVSRIDAAR